MKDKINIIFAAVLGAFFTVVIAGFGYVVNVEGRLVNLETRVGIIMGVSNSHASEDSNADIKGASTVKSEAVKSAIVNGCTKYMDSYNKIVSQGALYSSEKERLNALTNQMELLGCHKVLKQ